MKKISLNNLIYLILSITSVYFIYTSKINKDKYEEQKNLVSSLGDKIEIWKDKDSLSYARIKIIETSKTKDFLRIENQDSTIISLQKVVKKYKKKLGKKGTAISVSTGVSYDTIYKTNIVEDTLKCNRKGVVNNKFISSSFGFTKDSTYFNLKTRGRFSIIIGEQRNGFLKKSTPFAEVTNSSPYAEIKAFRVYRIINNKKINKYSAGPVIAYGFNLSGVPQLGGYIGFGIQYALIKF